ncbi:unnamed protein product, partial [Meganyctiphanes norvegica]
TSEDYKLLMKAVIKNELVDLKVNTHEGNFYIIFDPFYETTDLKIPENDVEVPHPTERSCQNDAPLCTVWQITAGLASGIAILLIIYIFYSNRNKYISQKLKV